MSVSIHIVAALSLGSSPVPQCGQTFLVLFEIVGEPNPSMSSLHVEAVFDCACVPVTVHPDSQNPAVFVARMEIPALPYPSPRVTLDYLIRYGDDVEFADSIDGECK